MTEPDAGVHREDSVETLSWTPEGLKVAVSVDGVASDSQGKDRQWVGEMANPTAIYR